MYALQHCDVEGSVEEKRAAEPESLVEDMGQEAGSGSVQPEDGAEDRVFELMCLNRPKRRAATQALENMSMVREWENAGENSELFKRVANKFEEEFRMERRERKKVKIVSSDGVSIGTSVKANKNSGAAAVGVSEEKGKYASRVESIYEDDSYYYDDADQWQHWETAD